MRNSKPKMFQLSLVIILIMAGAFMLVSWTIPMGPGMMNRFFAASDTIPSDGNRKMIDLDEAYISLEKAKEKLKEHDIAKEVAEALQRIDLTEMQSDLEDALADANHSLQDMQNACEASKIKEALSAINAEKMNAEIKVATQNLKPQIEKALKKTQIEIEKAQSEIRELKRELRRKHV
ncbi:hypothetical protein ABDK00_013840 [Niabella insulamsoli]|uniref:hypothetical protein n=1 Tax=Niabella insulamsoli TaxID=3144874 RepID=UPI0031FC5F2A